MWKINLSHKSKKAAEDMEFPSAPDDADAPDAAADAADAAADAPNDAAALVAAAPCHLGHAASSLPD